MEEIENAGNGGWQVMEMVGILFRGGGDQL